MKEKRVSTATIVTGVIALLAAAALIATLVIKFAFPIREPDRKYLDQALASADSDLPLMQSDIDTVFYTLAADGTVSFYEYAHGALQPIEPTGTVEVAPQCSGIQIPATLYYVQRGEQMTGYGLYNPPATGEAVHLYTYFFFNMRTLPPGYPNEGNTQFLLLMDSDAGDLYQPDKTYDESFFIQPFEEDLAKRTDFDRNQFVSQVNRLPGMDGRYWTDFAVFTEDTLACAANGSALFFSGRKYTDQQERKVDIYRRNRSSGAILTTRYTGVDYLYAYEDGDGIHYIRRTDTGFALYCNEQLILERTGDYSSGYLRDGNFLLDKADAVLINLLNGAQTPLPGADTSGAVLLGVSPGGEKCVIGTMADGDPTRQTLVLGDLQNAAAATVTDSNLFSSANAELSFIDSDRYFHNTPSAAEGATYAGRIFSFNEVFAQAQAAQS